MPKTLLASLATGYIFQFYSEFVFWVRIRVGDTLLDYVLGWLLYSLLAFVFLTLVQHFRVRSVWALFIGGAVFGWLAEGLIGQTTYQSLPMSISFTGLSWHAILTVWVGWYMVRQALDTSIIAVLRLAVGIGVFYGLWAIWWWTEAGGIATPPFDFALYAGITTIVVMVAYWLADRTTPAFKAGRVAKWVVAGLLLLYFCFITVPFAPIALVILPILLGISYVVLRRNQRVETRDSLLIKTSTPPLIRYLPLLAIPITASLIYALAYAQGWQWQTNWVVYIITMPLGFLLFAISALKIWRTKNADTKV